MRWRDPTIEPVTPHPDSVADEPERIRRPRWTTIFGIGLTLVLTVNVAVMVTLAYGSADSHGPAETDVLTRWNVEIDDPELRLPDNATICDRDGATVAEVVTIRADCTAGVVNRVEVVVARSASRSQEVLEILGAMFGDQSTFETAATGLTFDIVIRELRLTDPDDPQSADGVPLASASLNRFYERPGLLYGATLAMLLAIHVAAFVLRSRRWRLLLLASVACWAAILFADTQFLSGGKALTALAALVVASFIFNLIVLADQAPRAGAELLMGIDVRPAPPDIDLTLEPPPLSPRWGALGNQREDRQSRPPRIL